MIQVNEQTTAYLTITFKDKDGANAAPNSATYRIDCKTTGKAIRATTALPGGATPEIVLTSDENKIQNLNNSSEIKRVTIIGVYGVDDKVTDEFEYEVLNLAGV
jgi:hypothetical protein